MNERHQLIGLRPLLDELHAQRLRSRPLRVLAVDCAPTTEHKLLECGAAEVVTVEPFLAVRKPPQDPFDVLLVPSPWLSSCLAPGAVVRHLVDGVADRLVVLRLPRDSAPVVVDVAGVAHDMDDVLAGFGFHREDEVLGRRGEWVGYWRASKWVKA